MKIKNIRRAVMCALLFSNSAFGLIIRSHCRKPIVSQYPCALFSRNCDLGACLCQFINREECRIKIAAYVLTDGRVAKALEQAHNRGVTVQVVADGSMLGFGSKVRDLWQCGIPVRVYESPKKKSAFGEQPESLMHHKFAIFERNDLGKKVCWTGSFNPTVKGSKRNRENVTITTDSSIAHAYEKEFDTLFAQAKDRSFLSTSLHAPRTAKKKQPPKKKGVGYVTTRPFSTIGRAMRGLVR